MTVSKTYITGDTAVCYEAETVDELFALVSRFDTGDWSHASNQSNDNWIPWSGGDCPVAPDVRVDVKFRDGTDDLCGERAHIWGWDHSYGSQDIVAYRVVK